MKALGVVFLVVIAIASGLFVARAQREQGALQLQLDSAEAREVVLQQLADSLKDVADLSAAVAADWRVRWASARDRVLIEGMRIRHDTVARTDTVRVPVEVLMIADSAINACHVALDTCGARVAAERAVSASLREQLRIHAQLDTRPRTAIGASYNPHSAMWGAFIDRDFWRLRGGVTVEPAEQGLRVGVRIGWVF